MLKFENFRRIEGVDPRNTEAWASPWLEAQQFSAAELDQLRLILAEWDIDSSDIFAKPCSAFDGMAEVELDRWDVVDDGGTKLYAVWEYMGDSGMVFRYDKTDVLGSMVQFGGDFADEELATALEQARQAALEAEPEGNWPSCSFD